MSWSRRRRAASAALVLVAAAGLGLWTQRRPIADELIRRELVRAGVQASYQVRDIGFARQRLTDVVIGDPTRPDLTADWVEVETRVRFGTPEIVGVRAGRVVLRGAWRDGRISLGAIDALLPAPSGRPIELPRLDISVADARIRLDTPYGRIGIAMTGAGRVRAGFRGRAGMFADTLAAGDCRARTLRATLAVAIDAGEPHVTGPVRAAAAGCAGVAVAKPEVAVDAVLGNRFDRWQGRADVRAARVAASAGAMRGVTGAARFSGGPARTEGTVRLMAAGFAGSGAHGERLGIDGRYRVGRGGWAFDGSASAARIDPGAQRRQQVAALARAGAGTPVAPLLDRLGAALLRATQGVSAEAIVAVAGRGNAGAVTIARAGLSAPTGASVSLSGGEGVRYAWPSGAIAASGRVVLGGGDLPDAVVSFTRDPASGAISGVADMAPYATTGARLALRPVAFRIDGTTGTARTVATLSGPFSGGRIDGLTLPVTLNWRGERFTVGPQCVPARFERLVVSALTLDPAMLRVCPVDGALARFGGGAIGGGIAADRVALSGRIGSTPVTLAAARATFGLRGAVFAVNDVAARLGASERVTRLDLAELGGRVVGGEAMGRFAGGTGQIAAVPLAMSQAAGDWRFAGGRLDVTGAMRIDDATDARRFETVATRDFALTMAGNRIEATGTLSGPVTGIEVADVTIRHDLATGTGDAAIDVPGVRFATDGLQPAALTRLALGVVADVEGVVTGRGRIRWSPDGVDSDGVFATRDLNLAAAFGPVTGLSGELRFTDLLALETAPGQTVALAQVNPGIAVTGGQVAYRLLSGQRVAIDGGRWPFAGGELVLEPTVLDFSTALPRRMTFRVVGVNAAGFLQQFDFKNLNATGVFDGELPMVFDASGGRIENGRLIVREGGGSIAYVGELSEEDLGTWGNFAFQSLKSIRYQRLTLDLNGPLAGEMVTEISFAGVSQGEGTKSNFLTRRLARLPLVFNVRVTAPFRQLLDSVQSLYDPSRLVERNLPQLIERQQNAVPDVPRDVQPRESDAMPERSQ